MTSVAVPPTLLKAEDECRRARSFFVGTEHLFLAIAADGGPSVKQILGNYDVKLDEAVARVRKLIHHWEPDENWSGLLVHTPRLRRISERAAALATEQSATVPQARHFLAALLEDDNGHTKRALLDEKKLSPVYSRPAAAPTEVQAEGLKMSFEPAASPRHEAPAAARGGKSILEHFGRDLTKLAAEEKLSSHIGRDQELRLLVRTLTRQTKPNPIIVGEAGTGKTALVEGLAQWIIEGKVPPRLREAKIIELSMNTIVAGTQYRGEFEKRLELILAELKERPEVILFLDEFHLVVGAGAASGTMDAANVLKPALARGEIKCIAATTLREYRKHIEPDTALTRRFQTIMIDPPDDAATIEILNGIRKRFEEHHAVKITDEAIEAAVRLSARYESDRHQPDKSIDLLDDACTRVSVPTSFTAAESDEAPEVTAEHVAKSVADRIGVPVASLTDSEKDRLSKLKQTLSAIIQGQEEAVSAVTDAIREIRLGLRDENRPNGVFLFTGPTGVGKTALAEILGREFFGTDEALLRIDLSEYIEPHSVSRLIGAPPGYIGHDEQGQLTKALRSRPYRLVLLDEIEKAHPRILDIFLQVFGSGRLTDGRGDAVDCRQAMFVMTSNLGAAGYDDDRAFGFQTAKDDPKAKQAARVEAVREACQQHFRPEFINRIDRIICFNPLPPDVLRNILDKMVDELVQNLDTRGVVLDVPDDVRDALVKKAGTKQGVPPLKRLLRERITNRVVELMVNAPSGSTLQAIAIVGDGGIDVKTE